MYFYEFLESIYEILSDPSVPTHRVVRKAMLIAIALSLPLILYRHIILEFSSLGTITKTVALVFILICYLFFGGLLAGSLYEETMKKYKKSMEPTLSIHLLEWVVAIISPITLYFLPQPYGI